MTTTTTTTTPEPTGLGEQILKNVTVLTITTLNLGIIVTGSTGWSSRTVDLLSEDGSSLCELPDLNDDFSFHTQTGLIACGGSYHHSSCYTFDAGVWEKSHTLLYERYAHSAWNHSIFETILIGGTDTDGVTNSEILTNDGHSEELFPLRYYT